MVVTVNNAPQATAAWAHAPAFEQDADAKPHLLDDHLQAVGLLARQLAAPPSADWAGMAGLWHDLGKRRAGFQRYIRQASGATAHIEGRVGDRDKTHSAAGALWAAQHLQAQGSRPGLLISRALQYAIAGHHAGLDNWLPGDGGMGLAARLASDEAQREYQEALNAEQPADLLRPAMSAFNLASMAIDNEHRSQTPGRYALTVRMLFSALVDADFLDTESYMDSARARRRSGMDGTPPLPPMKRALDARLAAMSSTSTAVNRARASVLAQCRAKAALPPGVFSLTVPTGGGKTLASLAFALDHAVTHGKRRVVYAIPYTSIIEQTADVFRSVFASLGEDSVIEHHSNAESEPENETPRSRLACENWDAALIVTTNVQLFESLFARKTSRCRKLHSLINSVIVLDEAQLLPVDFLQPVVDVLRYLVQDFGVTVVLCTATQPALNAPVNRFDAQRGLRRGITCAGTSVTEIIDDVPALYAELDRVQVRLPKNLETPRSWPELADELLTHQAALTIVSRRADAADLYRLVKARAPGEPCWHLSALMCAQHRSDTIAQIKAALQARRDALAAGQAAQPVRVISTQLVEAGVDLDFPVVFRALAGLDSIAQAAGRCNREGKLPQPGQVYVFVPPTKAPPGLLSLGRDLCRKLWHDLPAQPLALPLVQRYFEHLYSDAPSTDKHGICELLKLEPCLKDNTLPVNFRSAAEAFKLIDKDDAATVLVRYYSPAAKQDVNALIGLLEKEGPQRWLLRKLQRYGVSIYQHQLKALLTAGDIAEVAGCPGLYVQREGWDGFYDPIMGARVDSAPGDPLVL
jgi:CRISPR-associated endonuclease/helicase Cas3